MKVKEQICEVSEQLHKMWRIDGEEYVFFFPPLNVGNEKMEKDGKKPSEHLVPRYAGIFCR